MGFFSSVPVSCFPDVEMIEGVILVGNGIDSRGGGSTPFSVGIPPSEFGLVAAVVGRRGRQPCRRRWPTSAQVSIFQTALSPQAGFVSMPIRTNSNLEILKFMSTVKTL